MTLFGHGSDLNPVTLNDAGQQFVRSFDWRGQMTHPPSKARVLFENRPALNFCYYMNLFITAYKIPIYFLIPYQR